MLSTLVSSLLRVLTFFHWDQCRSFQPHGHRYLYPGVGGDTWPENVCEPLSQAFHGAVFCPDAGLSFWVQLVLDMITGSSAEASLKQGPRRGQGAGSGPSGSVAAATFLSLSRAWVRTQLENLMQVSHLPRVTFISTLWFWRTFGGTEVFAKDSYQLVCDPCEIHGPGFSTR